MIGWHVSIYRLDSGVIPFASVAVLAASHPDYDDRESLLGRLKNDGRKIAEWGASLFGLDWIKPLEKEQKVLALSQHGYPTAYIGLARDLAPVLLLRARNTDAEKAEYQSCAPDDWLMVRAWDLS